MKRHPASETSVVARDEEGRAVTFICGIAVEPNQTEPVSLRSRHHPGFGMVTLMRNGKDVYHEPAADDWANQHTLQWYENRAAKNPRARWEIQVDGPLSGYTMRRIRGQWYVTETNAGFA